MPALPADAAWDLLVSVVGTRAVTEADHGGPDDGHGHGARGGLTLEFSSLFEADRARAALRRRGLAAHFVRDSSQCLGAPDAGPCVLGHVPATRLRDRWDRAP